MAAPWSRPTDRTSLAWRLRRSVRLSYSLLAAIIFVGAVATFSLLAVFHPRVQRLNTALPGLLYARAGMQDERAALQSYLVTRNPASLGNYRSAQARVAAANAAVVRAGLGGRDALDKLVALQSAQQAWATGWAVQVPAQASAAAAAEAAASATPGALAAFLSQGDTLFDAYTRASQQAADDFIARRNQATADERTVALAGFFTAAALIVFTGVLVGYQRRRAVAGVTEPVQSVLSTVRRIEAGETVDVDMPGTPAELAELGRVVIGMARELDSVRGAVSLSEFQASERQRKLMQVLDLTRAIGGNLSIRPVLEAVTRAAMRVSGASRVVLWVADDDGLHPEADSGGVPDEEGSEPSEPVVQAATYGRTARSVVGEPDLVPRMAVPMTFGGRVVGVLELRGDEILEMAPDDVDLTETLASNGASAVSAARAHGVTESLSMTDALTRLPNRRQLEHDLATECERARRYRRSSALIMLDVDGFKAFNDRYGHPAGDQVLAQFGQLLADSIRASDSAYRYGGEEFAVLVREASVAAAADLAERLRQQVADRFAVLPRDVPVTASFGVVGVDQVDPEPSSLIRAADEALYAAKERGRNRVVSFR